MSEHYTMVGCMSGSSLDGMDIALCRFSHDENKWQYGIPAAVTIPFPEELIHLLRELTEQDDRLSEADRLLSVWTAGQVAKFIDHYAADRPLGVVAHGHTIAHHPEKGYSLQIGNGKMLAEELGFPVMGNVRQADIAAGGQGAPLVPIADEELFPDFSACVNLGGICNISYNKEGQRIGYDICACNQLLNALASELGSDYDKDGEWARSGKVIPALLTQLNEIPFLRLPSPKSLDNASVRKAWVDPVLAFPGTIEDKLHTSVIHIAQVLGDHLAQSDDKPVLITGGGALNTFLVNTLEKTSGRMIHLPDTTLTDYKEALAMAFMGVLSLRKEPNCLPSVTGASHPVIAGEWHQP